jgi:eukaryotic-like serine/threonine-protein kinase
MTDASGRWRRVEGLCHAALERDARDRATFLTAACGDDEELRCEVEALLAHDRSAEGFLGSPVGAVAADVMSDPKASLVGRRIGAYEIVSPLGAGPTIGRGLSRARHAAWSRPERCVRCL